VKKTVAEKILSAHCGRNVSADDIAVCDVDFLMASDTTGGLAIKAFHEMGGSRVSAPENMAFFLDHAAPAPNRDIANTQKFIRDFAKDQGIRVYESGAGICHQLVMEDDLVRPGQLALGADSHTCLYGAVGAFSTGVGSTDLAVSMLTSRNWFRVPRTMKVHMHGEFTPGVYAKDFILDLIGRIGANGACYMSMEFEPDLRRPLDQRMTICNMVVECGAKNGLFYDEDSGIIPDKGCRYDLVLHIDMDKISPMVSRPNRVDNTAAVSELSGTKVQQGFLGSCTNGRIEDLRAAAVILRGKTIAPQCRLIVAPASVTVLKKAFEEGVMQVLLDAGAVLTPCGCGACVGTHNGIPADGETVISSSSRNFTGRMGNAKARIFLASAATVAASVLTGEITDPREVL